MPLTSSGPCQSKPHTSKVLPMSLTSKVLPVHAAADLEGPSHVAQPRRPCQSMPLTSKVLPVRAADLEGSLSVHSPLTSLISNILPVQVADLE